LFFVSAANFYLQKPQEQHASQITTKCFKQRGNFGQIGILDMGFWSASKKTAALLEYEIKKLKKNNQNIQILAFMDWFPQVGESLLHTGSPRIGFRHL
jgi:hypothetical protein